MDTPTPRTDAQNFGASCATDFCRTLERENIALRAALELERAENLKLKQGATLFDLEMFVTRQAYRLTDALKANASHEP
jgi:hypothetical protein